MNVDIKDIVFWMDAIRNSQDRYRTLESFWKGQINSKVWLIDNLKNHVQYPVDHKVAIYGGWNGVLASLLYNSGICISHITSVDIDPTCEETAYTMNKRHEMRGMFTAVTADMCEYVVEDAEIVINTSCEHITQDQYEQWLSLQPKDALFVLQSNNYSISEHIRIVNSLNEFIDQSKLNLIDQKELELPLYTRYMLIGKKQ